MKQKTVRIDAELLDALTEIKEELGIPVAEQIRRGMWKFVHEQDPRVNTGKESSTRQI